MFPLKKISYTLIADPSVDTETVCLDSAHYFTNLPKSHWPQEQKDWTYVVNRLLLSPWNDVTYFAVNSSQNTLKDKSVKNRSTSVHLHRPYSMFLLVQSALCPVS
jgi:hypothetical protein